MSEFAARIGRVRMKGGADLHILKRPTELPDRRGEIMRHTRIVINASEERDPLVGHMVVGFFASGKASVGIYHDPDTCPIPRALLPAWIEEIIRRDMVTDPEARDLFNEMFVWQGGA